MTIKEERSIVNAWNITPTLSGVVSVLRAKSHIDNDVDSKLIAFKFWKTASLMLANGRFESANCILTQKELKEIIDLMELQLYEVCDER